MIYFWEIHLKNRHHDEREPISFRSEVPHETMVDNREILMVRDIDSYVWIFPWDAVEFIKVKGEEDNART